jgi:hypothetical protein
MPRRFLCSLVLALFGSRLEAQSTVRPVGPIDSIVVVRTQVPGWPCPRCPPTRITLRRDLTDGTVLAAFRQKAESLEFYSLPPDVMGASFCRVVRSDALMATLTIYHPDGLWSVRGYHHCRDRSPEQTGLLALEALVDSVAALQRRRPPHER